MFGCDFDYFNELNSLLTDPNTPISLIFDVECFRGAFRKENAKLCQYILLHLTEIVDYAFGLKKGDENNPKIQSNALFILTTQSPSFSKQLTINRTYLLKLMSFIKNDEPVDKYILTTFCFIFQFMIKLTDGFIFIHLPEKDKFISRLASHILHNSVFDFLIFLSTSQNQVVIDYLTNSQAVLKLLSSMDEESTDNEVIIMNKRKFQILTNIAKNAKASFLPNQILRRNTIEFIIDYSMSKRCSNGFIFISYVWDFFQYKKVSTSIPQIIKSLSDNFCEFILDSSLPFNHSKYVALNLLSRAITSGKFLTDRIYEMAEELWNLFFDKPYQSMLHEAFLIFINSAISVNQKIIDKIKLREKIIDAFKARQSTIASYWGHLHFITAIILRSIDHSLHVRSRSQMKLKSNSKIDSKSFMHSNSQANISFESSKIQDLPEFNKYINDVFIPTETFLSTGYGGNLPKKQNINDNQSSFSLFSPSSYLSSEKCNASILSFLKHKFRDNDESKYINDDDEEEEEEEEEEEKKNEEENEEEDEEEQNTDEDEDENESSNVDDSESDNFFSLYDFQQIKADPNVSIKSPISLKLQGTLFVTKVPKKIVFGRGGLIIGIASDISLEIFKFPDLSRVKTRNFDTTLLSFTFSEDESQYFCCFFNKIIVFNLLDSTMSRAYCIEKSNRIVMHDTSTRFCTFHDDGRIRAFKLPQNIEIASFKVEKNENVSSATFSNDGRYLIVGYQSGLISLFDIDQKKLIQTVKASHLRITSFCFDSVNNFLFSAADEKLLKKWIRKEDSLEYERSFNFHGAVSAMDIKGNWLVSGSTDKTFSMTNIEKNQICYNVKSHSSPILCIAFASYKDMFATASKDKTVKVWTYQNSKK